MEDITPDIITEQGELATQNKKPPSNTERLVVDPEGHDPTTFGL